MSSKMVADWVEARSAGSEYGFRLQDSPLLGRAHDVGEGKREGEESVEPRHPTPPTASPLYRPKDELDAWRHMALTLWREKEARGELWAGEGDKCPTCGRCVQDAGVVEGDDRVREAFVAGYMVGGQWPIDMGDAAEAEVTGWAEDEYAWWGQGQAAGEAEGSEGVE